MYVDLIKQRNVIGTSWGINNVCIFLSSTWALNASIVVYSEFLKYVDLKVRCTCSICSITVTVNNKHDGFK